jgi:hypothetical protein
MTWDDQVSQDLNKTYPNAIDGDAVIYFGATDGQELWVKYGTRWQLGWAPGSGPGMTAEARPDYKRIIADLTQQMTPGLPPTVGRPVTTATGVSTGHIVLFGLLGLFLLRGAIK